MDEYSITDFYNKDDVVDIVCVETKDALYLGHLLASDYSFLHLQITHRVKKNDSSEKVRELAEELISGLSTRELNKLASEYGYKFFTRKRMKREELESICVEEVIEEKAITPEETYSVELSMRPVRTSIPLDAVEVVYSATQSSEEQTLNKLDFSIEEPDEDN